MSHESLGLYKSIKVSVVDHICTVMLSRPERRNAYTESMRAELCDAFEKASTNEDVRVVVLTGDPAGQAFCAGADLGTGDVGKEFTSGSAKYDVPNGRKVDNGTFRDGGGVAALSVLRCTKPIIAAMNGTAVGVGMTLPCVCDIRIAAHDAKVGFVFVRRGLACESVSSWILPKLIGMGQAMELVLTGRVFKTQDAPSGLFNYIVPEDQVVPKALEIAREIVANTSAMSVALSRLALIRNFSVSPEEAHLAESRIIHFMSTGPDSKEGLMSFLEKRAPDFKLDPYKDLPPFFPWWKQTRTDSKL